MYVLTVNRRLAWLVAAFAVVALGIWTGQQVNPAVVENEETAAVSAASATLQPNLRPIYAAQTNEKVIALTFDISWGTVMAPKVLDVLKQEQIRATFFLSGPWAKQHPELVQRIKADGHEIESHGQEHVDLNTLGREGAARNISKANAILEQMTGRAPTYIRPPNGAFNKESVQAAKDLGYATVIWSVDSLDWKNPGVQTIITRSTRLIHPGAIVLMHASDSCKQTDQALPTVISTWRQQGYHFLLLDELVRKYGVDMNGYIHTKIPVN
ncbi:MAG: polysaccharide deacetylase family sporulation protein PdaB [Mycobacterium leprae]